VTPSDWLLAQYDQHVEAREAGNTVGHPGARVEVVRQMVQLMHDHPSLTCDDHMVPTVDGARWPDPDVYRYNLQASAKASSNPLFQHLMGADA
jgi:hypothetical protein